MVFDGTTKSISISSFKINQVNFLPSEYIRDTVYILVKRDYSKENFSFIDKIQYKDNKFFIIDKSNKVLSVFDKKGDFIQNIGTFGNGPSELRAISDFDVDESGAIYILDGFRDKDRLFIYDSKFELQKVEELPFEADVVKATTKGYLLFGLSSWNMGDFEGSKILRTDMDLGNAKPILKFDEELIESIWMDYQFGFAGSDVYYNKPIDNNVHIFDEEGMLKRILAFDFNDLNVPNNLKNNLEENMEEIRNFRYLSNFLVSFDKGYLGSLYDQGDYRVFLMDTIKDQLFMGEKLDFYGFTGQFVGCEKGHVITYFDPEYVGEENFNDLPEFVIEHLKADEFVIRLLKLK
jgi:hypothetical protein